MMDLNSNDITVSSTPTSKQRVSRTEDTPVGDIDNHFKVHLTVEFLNANSTSIDKTMFGRYGLEPKPLHSTLLKITISGLKCLPKKSNGDLIDPFVKLRLVPENVLWTTELKKGKDRTYFFDSFEHWMDSTDGRSLKIEVCDKRNTRRAHIYGSLDLDLSNLQKGQPIEQWYNLVP